MWRGNKRLTIRFRFHKLLLWINFLWSIVTAIQVNEGELEMHHLDVLAYYPRLLSPLYMWLVNNSYYTITYELLFALLS